MINATVSYLLGLAMAALAGIHVLPLLAAAIDGQWPLAGLFLASLLFAVFLAGAFLVASRGRDERPNRMQFILLIAAVWLVLPAIGALPLYASGVLDKPISAYFEAVSGLTTTGATVIGDLDALSRAIVLWRASLQWLGGLFSLLTILLMLAPFGVSGAPVNAHIPGYERGNLAKSAQIVFVSVLPVYGALTALCFFALWAAGLPGLDALCVAFSTLSTGGFMPRNGGLEIYQSPLASAVLCLFMVAGATSFLAHRAHLRRHYTGHHGENPETLALLISIGVVAVVLSAVFIWRAGAGGQGGWVEAVAVAVFRATSLVTTTGFDSHASSWGTVPFVIALSVCFIGGAAFSSAGGIKIFRGLLMMRQALREIERLIHPHGITQARSIGRTINIPLMKSIWVLFFIYLLTAAVLALLLSMEGLGFEMSLMAAIAALSNVGPAVAMSVSKATGLVDYTAMAPLSLLWLCLGMILGRVELLVLFTIGNVSYWRS
jgi:trk system potassium uptake protein TrkH